MRSLKMTLLGHMRRRRFQPLWDRLAHLAHMGQNYWATEVDFSGELAVLDQLKPRLTIDVGANIGRYAVAASRYGRVIAFEPSSVAYAKIPQGGAIEAVNMALGAAPGTATLHGTGESIASILDQRSPRRPLVTEEQVEVSTLDDFCRERGIDDIDLLKIDVEGFEHQVLLGARETLPHIRHVQFEFGHIDAPARFRDFVDLMPGRQFYRVVSDGLWPVKYTDEIEACMTSNFVASLPPPQPGDPAS
jgi:FkbM family methyltransferase